MAVHKHKGRIAVRDLPELTVERLLIVMHLLHDKMLEKKNFFIHVLDVRRNFVRRVFDDKEASCAASCLKGSCAMGVRVVPMSPSLRNCGIQVRHTLTASKTDIVPCGREEFERGS